jgi:hypothetical protein
MAVSAAREPSLTPRPAAPPTPTATKARTGAPPAEFARVLGGLGREVQRGESLVRSALGAGDELAPAALIALQAGVYRYAEVVDLASRLIDRAASSVKTVLDGQ